MESTIHAFFLQKLATPFIPTVSLIFLLDFINRKPKYSVCSIAMIVPVISMVLSLTWETNGFYYKSVTYDGAVLHLEPSPVTYFFSAYQMVVLLLCLAVIIWAIFNKIAPKKQLFLLLFCYSQLIVTFLFYSIGLDGQDQSPVTFCIPLIIFYYLVYRANLLNLLPLAKDTIIQQMKDAFLILDGQGYYLYSNPAADEKFPILKNVSPGERIDIGEYYSLREIQSENEVIWEMNLSESNTPLYYRISNTPIYQNKKLVCQCVVCYDITDNKNLMDELLEIATYDSLTQIYNRSSFFSLAKNRVDNRQTSLTMIGLDIDFFKKVNDTYGHPGGDAVLREIASLVKARLRQSDIFGRLGGEEFGIIMEGASYENACKIAESIRTSVEAHVIEYDQRDIRVTVSIGLAHVDHKDPLSLDELMLQADNALYEAKQAGRNRVVAYLESKK